ncbi:MAG: hypothetical protein V3W20_10920 [Candidatus Neomarinimicrobiota bacterium]
MGPGFLIFFKNRKKSSDLVNIRPPKWLYEEVEYKIAKKIRKTAKKSIWNVEQVKKAILHLSESRHTPSDIKKFIDHRDIAAEVLIPKSDSEYVLTIILQWCFIIKLRDDEEAILSLILY